MNVYEIVTSKMIEKLNQGVAPWRQPWKPGLDAMNWFTGKPYRGINRLLTEPGGEYATYNQIVQAGGRIKPAESKKYTIVVFYKDYEKEDEESGETKKIPVLKYYRVYEINTQCEGLTSKRPPVTEDTTLDPIDRAEQLIKNFADAPEITFKTGKAVYHPFFDRVSVPPLRDYTSAEEYYCTLFHELVHSTGHKDRLNRDMSGSFGDKKYAKEELIAEIGAAMLCGVAGIEQPILDNSAAYIQSWLKALRNDSRLVVTAANAAQKAADYIQNIKPSTVKMAS